MPHHQLIISLEADADLERIYADGFERWGEQQADLYYDDLLSHFDMLCENPYLFRAVEDVRKGYRRSVCGKHAIYYRVQDNTVEIMGLVKHENRYS